MKVISKTKTVNFTLQTFCDTEGFQFDDEELNRLDLETDLLGTIGECFEKGDLAIWYDDRNVVWSDPTAHGVLSRDCLLDNVWMESMGLTKNDFEDEVVVEPAIDPKPAKDAEAFYAVVVNYDGTASVSLFRHYENAKKECYRFCEENWECVRGKTVTINDVDIKLNIMPSDPEEALKLYQAVSNSDEDGTIRIDHVTFED